MFTSTIRLFIPPPPPPTLEVPLAVWSSPIDNQPGEQPHPPWLPRLIDEYALARHPVSLYAPMPAGPFREDLNDPEELGAEEHGAAPADVGLVIALLHQSPLDAGEIDQHVTDAAAAVRPGGRLAVVTRQGRQPKRRRYDSVSVTVTAAVRHGFGFLQHLVITNPDGVGESALRLPVRRTTGIPTHHPAHLDAVILQAPAAGYPAQESL